MNSVGDRIRHGFHRWTLGADTPKWQPQPVAVENILSNAQFVDVMIGDNVRKDCLQVLQNLEARYGRINTPKDAFFAVFGSELEEYIRKCINVALRRRGMKEISKSSHASARNELVRVARPFRLVTNLFSQLA